MSGDETLSTKIRPRHLSGPRPGVKFDLAERYFDRCAAAARVLRNASMNFNPDAIVKARADLEESLTLAADALQGGFALVEDLRTWHRGLAHL